ncbi:MAG: DegV family protein, partial [Dehalococcoidia bacterium]|nr:DegV family protein [Dehalococcoidia bacterium]
MTIKIVTDSTADLPPDIAQQLGISVVPLNVSFGKDNYKDGVDITADDFYRRLGEESVLPLTSAPSPGSFKDI